VSWIINNRRRLLRRMVQLSVIFLLVSPLFQLPVFSGTLISGTFFGINMVDPVAAMEYVLATKTFYVPVMTGCGILLALYLIVGGRAFCGWVCPMYLVSELVAKLPRRWQAFPHAPGHSTPFWAGFLP